MTTVLRKFSSVECDETDNTSFEEPSSSDLVGGLARGVVLGGRRKKSLEVVVERKPGMNEVNESGYALIHQSVVNNYAKSVEKFIKANGTQLEFETQDGLKETPLLIAVRTGIVCLETITTLQALGANLRAQNTLNHGIVEIACTQGHTEVLEHFVENEVPEVPVWKNVLKFCSSDLEEESEGAGGCLSAMTRPKEEDVVNPNWRPVYDNGGILTLVKVVKSEIGDRAKAQAIQCLINMLMQKEVKDQVASAGGIEAFIRHLRSPTSVIIKLVSVAIALLCKVRAYADTASQLGVIPALVKVLQTNQEPEVLIESVNALGVVCDGSEPRQTMLYNTGGGIQCLCALLADCMDASLLYALTQAISRITRRHMTNQNCFIDCGGASHIITLTNFKNKEIQLSAVDTAHMLAEGNPYTQRVIQQEGAIYPLMNLLKRSKNQTVQEKTAGALWALAGDDGEERRLMAARMEVNLLIEFLGSLSETLHFIGSEGLGVLAQGAHNKQDEIAEANGVHPLVRLLKCDKEYLVLSAVRSLRHMCVSVGYIPHPRNQSTVTQARGIKLLIALMTLSKSELIQVESALTLASVSLGNPEVMEEIWNSSHNLEFSYVRILKLLYSSDDVVRLLAGAALATFAYNNMSQQQAIAAEGGVRFNCFSNYLQSEDEYFRCNAAFQVVVLSRIIPDEEQAVSSAAGIKLIVDILNDSKSTVIQALAADCVARLAHTRAGVPAAFVAIDTVNRLCDLMTSDAGQVRGSTAVALSYLSYNHKAERQLLNRCRLDPYIIKCLFYYAEKHRISPQFLTEWKHYKKLGGLPAIKEGRPPLETSEGFHAIGSVTKPNELQALESKSNLNSGSNTSIRQSHSSLNEENGIRSSRVSFHGGDDQQDTLSERSVSRSIAVE